MVKGDKRWLAACGAVVVVGAVIFAVHHRRAPAHLAGGDEAAGDQFNGFASRPFTRSGTDFAPPVPPPSPAEIAKRADDAMARWRTAIVNKDGPTVVSLDMSFEEQPDWFVPDLAKSAAGDENERVRAFSTRVLGKMKRTDQAPLFQKLLVDKSPYVRQNAAWALGELGSAGALAMAELRHATRDPALDVRTAAKAALGKVE